MARIDARKVEYSNVAAADKVLKMIEGIICTYYSSTYIFKIMFFYLILYYIYRRGSKDIKMSIKDRHQKVINIKTDIKLQL